MEKKTREEWKKYFDENITEEQYLKETEMQRIEDIRNKIDYSQYPGSAAAQEKSAWMGNHLQG